jgi:UDP-N-acetyl-D-mannosaminuronate dehydrogenase
VIKGSKVLIMGLTYKKNVADMWESPVRGIVERFSESVARSRGDGVERGQVFMYHRG